MTDQVTEEEGRIHSLEELSEKVDRILAALPGLGQGGSEPEPEPAADPKAEMRAELAKLQAAEKRKQAREQEKAATEGRFKAIEEKLKEKPPREYSRVTNFMGWRGDDDK